MLAPCIFADAGGFFDVEGFWKAQAQGWQVVGMDGPLSRPITKLTVTKEQKEIMPDRKILIVSDHPQLARAIELGLQPRQPVTWLARESSEAKLPSPDGWAAIIVSLCSHIGEPLAALQRAGLTPCIGHVPILIVSERPFEAGPRDLVQHLDYPFTPEALKQAVDGLLAQATRSDGRASETAGVHKGPTPS